MSSSLVNDHSELRIKQPFQASYASLLYSTIHYDLLDIKVTNYPHHRSMLTLSIDNSQPQRSAKRTLIQRLSAALRRAMLTLSIDNSQPQRSTIPTLAQGSSGALHRAMLTLSIDDSQPQRSTIPTLAQGSSGALHRA
ncbi:hypothetical protein, partial [Vibrio coralliilyticus]|uniref:hypothetical protein n=1 Tax=Vibrio coralliilyticus TaxID=190893 RepID=UPI001C5569BD